MTNRPLIQVYLITFRRSHLLKRSLGSVLSQTYRNITVKVINDDPSDVEVESIVSAFDDSRVSLFVPVEKRGATRNLNIPFENTDIGFVSILEDDNWWQPEFLETMHEALCAHPDIHVAVGNEVIWREMKDGEWQHTGRRIWDFDDLRIYNYSLEELCGSAKLCNSSMLVRMTPSANYKVPDVIPVDVTEHFRERLFQQPILLVGAPLVNYAETLTSARSKIGSEWAIYQCLLIGSIFIALRQSPARYRLAQRLWKLCTSKTSPRATSLVTTGLLISEARALLACAPVAAHVRFLLWAARRPKMLWSMLGSRRRYRCQLDFLSNAPLTTLLAAAERP